MTDIVASAPALHPYANIDFREPTEELKCAQPRPFYDITATMISKELRDIHTFTCLLTDLDKIIATYSEHQYEKLWRAYSAGTDLDYETPLSNIEYYRRKTVNPEISVVYVSLCSTSAIRGGGNSWIHNWMSVQNIIDSIKDFYTYASVDSPVGLHSVGSITNLGLHLNELKNLGLADDEIICS